MSIIKLRSCSKKILLLLIILALLGGVADKSIPLLVTRVLNIPLFLDMIFCLAFSFINPILGFICTVTGYVFSLIYEKNMLFFLFSICTFCGIITVWLFKKFVMDKNSNSFVMVFAEVLILCVLVCIVESVTGGIISRIIGMISGTDNYPTYQTDFIILMFRVHVKSPLVAAIISRFPVNIADRFISVPISFLAYLGIKRMMGPEVK